jgi:hypothetical protein
MSFGGGSLYLTFYTVYNRNVRYNTWHLSTNRRTSVEYEQLSEMFDLCWTFLTVGSNSFLIRIVGGGVLTGSTRHIGHFWPIVHAPGDCEDGEFGGMKIERGK